MAITLDGQPIITGYIYDTADFDPGAGVFNLVPSSFLGGDFFISKSGSCALPYPLGPITAPASVCEWSEILVSVDSSYGATDYNWDIPAGSGVMAGFFSPNITLKMGASSGTITVVPSNACGFGPGTSVNITVDALPIFALQPMDQTVDENTPTTFTTNCIGTSLVYKWQKKSGNVWGNVSNNALYSGVTNNTLNISNCDLPMNGTYFRCIVTNASCTDTTDEVLLTVNDTINIPSALTNTTEASMVSIYPNISDGHYMFQNGTTHKDLSYTIYDMAGQLLRSGIFYQGVSQLNLDNEAIGVYFIQVALPEKTKTFKLIKTGAVIK